MGPVEPARGLVQLGGGLLIESFNGRLRDECLNTDPKTLTRAARDHVTGRLDFAVQCAHAAPHWISAEYGYELSGIDVQDAHRLALDAASAMQQTPWVRAAIDELLAAERPGSPWMRQVLTLNSQ